MEALYVILVVVVILYLLSLLGRKAEIMKREEELLKDHRKKYDSPKRD